MATKISDTEMSSDQTRHTARAADPVLALHRMHVRLGYDRQAHLAWHDREHPGAIEYPREPFTEDETRAVIAAYSAKPAPGAPAVDEPDADAVTGIDACDRADMISVMTDHERSWLLSFIAGYAPQAFDHALRSRPGSFADELLGRIEDRDDAEYMAEPEGYCAACGENASWFIGHEGPQHFRGPHKLVTGAERRELFTPEDGHEPVVAWRESAAAGRAAEAAGGGR